jgi:hypothetical protein
MQRWWNAAIRRASMRVHVAGAQAHALMAWRRASRHPGGGAASSVINQWSGGVDRRAHAQLAVFAHFDPAGEVSGAVLHHLAALSSARFATVFVTTSPTFSESARQSITDHVAAILHRRNVGYDFGSWKEGLNFWGSFEACNALLLVNDSILGPFTDVSSLLARMTDDADIWGLTDSREIAPHLQSYFLLVRRSALHAQAFKDFWRKLVLADGRDYAVHFGELGFSRTMHRAGFRLRALAPYEAVVAKFRENCLNDGIVERMQKRGSLMGRAEILFLINDRHPLNPTHLLWREVMDDFAIPYVKRELVDRNPTAMADVDDALARLRAKGWRL